METVVLQNFCYLGRHLEFIKNFIFNKNAANFIQISRKYMFAASDTNMIKNRVEK